MTERRERTEGKRRGWNGSSGLGPLRRVGGLPDVLTSGDAQRLRTGMRLIEVQRPIGAPGEQLSATASHAVSQWKISPASDANVTFTAGRINTLATVGLNEPGTLKKTTRRRR
ncbi:hypothetical protein [Deinococcus multiflagellatus]|uniref:Uncharacterized protein n=1 Tax=Deinococcus multiflagellatus TaxID=1656887 RepID=A0ABW1ZMH2_9DEIO|nr:hypothetical protein [Deinococcus multiflagellatus]MBZ9713999.1 hypothetical protein [Deinococcus multiflagellatus]